MKSYLMKEMGEYISFIFRIYNFEIYSGLTSMKIYQNIYKIISNNRYDKTTGTFTVPPGGEDFYYFSVFFLVYYDEWARFDIEINEEVLCTAQKDQSETTNDAGQAACSAATYANEGGYSLVSC